MGGKKAPAGEGSKKAQGQARKADAAAAKVAQADAKKAAVEDADWESGAKNSAKKEAAAAKAAEALRKKTEREALLAEEEKSLPSRAGPKNTKSAQKKTNNAPSRGLDLSQLEGDPSFSSSSASAPLSALNASGIDNALDALSLTKGGGGAGGASVDRHPERRFKAAYAAFEERRLREGDEAGEFDGLRQNQKKDKIRKEFEKSPENPFNQVTASYDATKEELAATRKAEAEKIEKRLGR